MAKRYQLVKSQVVPVGREELFAFFMNVSNLERLTPPFLHFRILTPLPIVMGAGTVIEYQLSLFGVPFRWKTLIEKYEVNRFFIDVQLAGPYHYWHHRHDFGDVAGGTEIRDTVDYELPLGVLGEIGQIFFVRRQLETIFEFRQKVIRHLFGGG